MSTRRVASTIHSWINNSYHKLPSAEILSVPNPNTGGVLTSIEAACSSTVNLAVESAEKGQREWSSFSGTDRGRILRRAADLLTQRNDELAELEAIDTGRPISETICVDIVSARDCIEFMAGLCSNLAVTGTHVPLSGEPGGSFAYTRREPLGVTAGIGAWNYPIQGMAWKVAPALACGNSIVFKPSELTPLTALALAEIFADAGLPEGVLNVVVVSRSHSV
eukprot:g1210.t1